MYVSRSKGTASSVSGWHMAKALAIALCIGIAGCTATGGLFSSSQSGRQERSRVQRVDTPIDAQGLGVYLEVMRDLVEGDEVTQAEVFQTVSNDAATAATTTNRLKLALALSIPGHANSNADHAQQELRQLLASDQLLLPEERVIAAVQLRDVEQRLILDIEAQQSQIEAQQAIERQNSDAAQRISALEGENRELRERLEGTQRTLEEMQQTLDEITNIERSIRERDSGAN